MSFDVQKYVNQFADRHMSSNRKKGVLTIRVAVLVEDLKRN